ncbi:sensor histidine kinase [Rhizobium sp. BK377]|uniref:sensor histidine kinase n=1 Tax=Rhizobium sp. BK377 TaxID=2587058 RepID=UPI00161A0A6D|nr:HAMP domain-containing sensor histidine kinase [Rhizobium sp. BK377]MBB3462554.1 signal transduction histidine kinase [Rhizobium sp. BK377]
MKTMKFYSLKWRLIRRLVALQAATLVLIAIAFAFVFWISGMSGIFAPDEHAIDAVSESIAWNADGSMRITNTDDLGYQRDKAADFWFLVRDQQGRMVSEGNVPAQYLAIAASGSDIAEARFNGDEDNPATIAARLQKIKTDHGDLLVIVGRQGSLSAGKLLVVFMAIASGIVLPVILLTGLITLAVTPFVARGIHRGLSEVAQAAQGIDGTTRGYRLPLENVPEEVAPLVIAMNETLQRLDDDHNKQRRFMLAAAHELRTPIAILQNRLETMPPTEATNRLLEDVARLSTLAQQLLDLQRLNQEPVPDCSIDLATVARRQAAELAPLIIAAGYQANFELRSMPERILGDETALERAIANLVQNAIQHGGRSGTITIAVERPAQISVSDEGPGIAAEDRERIFEPFQRANGRSQGIGLGLHLVREIVKIHHGRVWVSDAAGGGASFNMSFESTVQPA